MQKLNKNTITNPTAPLPTKILQFGGGNFLRAFVDWMVQILNEKADFNAGIAIVKPTEYGDYQNLKDQDGLFTVILDGIKNGQQIQEIKRVDCINSIINPYTEWERYLELSKDPNLRFVISNTTEAGIKFNSEDGFNTTPPKEFPAKLTLFLYQRFQFFNQDPSKGMILLPCELIENNGLALQKAVLEYAKHWRLESEFTSWILTANHFCSSLVDRIVSGYPKERAKDIEAKLGYRDPMMVAGEYYHSWVIQASGSVHKELPFDQTDLNVQFVDDLVPYRDMKVRILNGAHTALVPTAYLAGTRLVDEALEQPEISRFINELLMEETILTLNFPQEVKQQFVADVLDRFRNPLLKHQLISIALNSTSKFVARLLPTLKDYLALENTLPKRIVFGLAALLYFYRGNYNGERIDLKDDPTVLSFFKESWDQYDQEKTSLEDTINQILANTGIWGENLNEIPSLTKMLVNNVTSIKKQGVLGSLRFSSE
ncbi:Altronate oxidoreductase [Arenibacter antarcticus]|uniref:Tagaturonate reductase n=1 Tax=Arenibacter antarcticus TaxID=2040469 RepID=A0ABW5VIB9_9FLAO|nr:tagaturonate reductase [Arenibacter sp. H213]MCM4167233.1 tagaturonate reductase [Arenibacter sp. H213]